MITVKATTSRRESTDPADQYKQTADPKRSRTPFILGAVFAALAVYLKSAFGAAAAELPTGPSQQARPPADPDTALQAEEKSQLPRPPGPQNGAIQAPAENAAVPAGGSAVRFHTNPFIDTNARQTIEHARSNLANINAVGPDLADMIDLAQVFGTGNGANTAGPLDRATPATPETMASDAADRNRAPRSVRPTYLLDVASGGAIAIALTDLLANVTDANGDALRVENVTVSAGSVVPVPGGFIYRAAAADPLGPVVVSYQVSDGKAVTSLSATFSVVPNNITGTAADDSLAGTNARDHISGNDGDDFVNAQQGHDLIQGGAGDDTILGGVGDDSVFGGAGNDFLFGGAGQDQLYGGAGHDGLFGEDGDDVLLGGDGNDTLNGGAGADTLSGDVGNDIVTAGAGADSVLGGDGNDVVIASPDAANDVYDGGTGQDTLDYSTAVAAVRIDLTTGVVTGTETGSDAIAGFETIKAGSGNDYIIIGNDEVILNGGSGDNVFEFIEIADLNAPPVTVHQILDFGVGDVIKTGLFDVFSASDDTAQTLFDALQGADTKGHIRIRYEQREDREDTVVEWDTDDFGQITMVKLDGRQTLVCVEND